jgi:hypothetical protein
MRAKAKEQSGPRFIIYALTDLDTGLVRYIGASRTGMLRAQAHIHILHADMTQKEFWIQSLREQGKCYGILVLEVVRSHWDLASAKRRWIRHGDENGWPLLNVQRKKSHNTGAGPINTCF